jgi:hypothetical protein
VSDSFRDIELIARMHTLMSYLLCTSQLHSGVSGVILVILNCRVLSAIMCFSTKYGGVYAGQSEWKKTERATSGIWFYVGVYEYTFLSVLRDAFREHA